jgi:hypothetical protein
MKIYPSKVDWWLGSFLVATPLFIIALGLYLIPISKEGAIIAILSGIFTGSLMAALAIPCRYILDEDGLTIQAGLLKEKIQYKEIKGAELSSNPLSAPALSLRRVKIILGSGFRLISPVNRKEFIEELKNKI